VRTRAALVLGLLMAGAAMPAARAHESRPGLSLRFERVEPAIEGLEAEVRDDVAPTVILHNRTGRRVEVIGLRGEAILRIGPDRVEGNLASPDWWRSESPAAGSPVPATARVGAPARWVRLADGADWAWYEHRLDRIVGPGTPWSIPIRVGAREAALTGTWEAIVVYGSFRTSLTGLGVSPPVADLVVSAVPGSEPVLFVQNATGRVLEIPGPEGEPFIRVGPGGAELAAPGGGYERVAAGPAWGWVEPRAGWTGGEIPARLRDATGIVRVGTWSIPATLGGEDLRIEGTLDWVPVRAHHATAPPPPGELDTGTAVAVLAVAGLLLAAAVALLVRRRRALDADGS
jgi:LPXTG-motif cell wall-anchored protein